MKNQKCVVQMTLTTYDEDLCRIVGRMLKLHMRDFDALEMCMMSIPTVVWLRYCLYK